MTARLARYSRELARDFLVERGIAILLILGIFTYAQSVANAETWAAMAEPLAAKQVAQFAAGFAASNLLLVAMVAFIGIIASDRKAGYTRFLFAKPLDPVAYYAAKWLVHGGMLLACLGLWAFVVAVSRQWFDPMPFAMIVGVRLFLYGGMLVLASSVGRAEFLWFALVYISGFILRLAGANWNWPPEVAQYAAPWTSLDTFDAAAQAGRRVTLMEVGYPVAFGLACLVLAMVIIRRRSLSG